MESSKKPNCNEDDDTDSLETIKLHDRFVCDSYNDNDEEFFSDDNDYGNANEYHNNTSAHKTGCFATHEYNYCSMLSSNRKAETLSMLDSVQHSCHRSGQNFTLDVLSLKSDESGLSSPVCMMLGEALYCHPPFGDPPSGVDLLNSALSLLEEGSEMSKKFREVGCVDGHVVSNVEKLVEAEGSDCTHSEPNAMLFDQKTPQNIASTLEVPKVKLEGYKDSTVSSSVVQELSENISQSLQLNCNEEPKCSRKDVNLLPAKLETNEKVFPSGSQAQIERNTCSRKAKHKKRTNGSSPMKNAGIGKVFTLISPCVEDELMSDNQNAEKNVSCLKETLDLLVPVMSNSSTKDPGKTKGEICDVSSLSSSLPFASTKNEMSVSSREETVSVKSLDRARSTICNIGCVLPQDLKTTAEISLGESAVAEDEEEFTVVLSRKKSRLRKDTNTSVGANSADILPKTIAEAYSRVNSCGVPSFVTGAYMRSTSSASSKLSLNSAGNPRVMLSKQLPSSNLSESGNVATKTSGRSRFSVVEKTSEHLATVDSFCSESVTNVSYASILSQQMPYSCGKQAAMITSYSDIERNKSMFSHGVEIETDGFLSPPQSEADTGFSSSSSLSSDETQATILCTVADGSPERKAGTELVEQTFSSQNALLVKSVSCKTIDKDCVDSSNVDAKFSDRCPKPERKMQKNNGAHCKKQSKSPQVFFDTRKHRLTNSTSCSGIIFGFDSGKECSHGATNPESTSDFALSDRVIDATHLAFFASALEVSSDGEPAVKLDADRSLDRAELRNIAEKTSGDEPRLAERTPLQTITRVAAGVEFKDNESGAKLNTPIYGRFDLYAAQKFLSKAFWECSGT